MQFRSLITDDPYGALASWGGGNWSAVPAPALCRWRGVTCGARGRRRGRVTALDLRGLGLLGAVAPSLCNLTYLRRLDLRANRLHGALPPPDALRRLAGLEYLNLSHNTLQGPVPRELGSLRRLQVLNLGYNNLTGSIPESLGNLTSLTVLTLTQNNLVGSIPDTLGNLNALTGLYLNGNMLEGSIPPSVCNLSSLQKLVVQINNLSGSLPHDIGDNLPSLRLLSVDGNQFRGVIPVSMCNASKLEVIQMLKNSFSGVVPECLGVNLKNLWALLLDANQLEAKVDADWRFMDHLTNCSNMRAIGLSGNKLGGVLPSSIANLSTNMEWLSLSINMIAGQIPQGIGNLVKLNTLYMHLNNLSGTIPASLGKLQRLSNLYLYGNKLYGPIPPTIGNLTVLSRLFLDTNMLTGPIPSSLGSCPLETLNLQYNRLTGPIPKEVFLISTLSTDANFQGNMLTGSLPSEVGNLKNLQLLDVSGNKLTGEIPASLGDCQVLQYCIMKGNILQGKIPASVGQLRGLLSLDLSQNNLSGHIPGFLGSMQALESLDISFNNFEGEVPKSGIFLNASAFSVEGNTALCGGIPQLNLPPCPNNSGTTTSKRPHNKLVMTISIAIAILGVALLLAVFVFWRQRSKTRKAEQTLPVINDPHVRVSYANLLSATNGFASENLIGIGSFGSVYKGTMMSHDQEVVVAVKVLNLEQRGASQSFVAECETLRCTRHRNLVKILTVCSSIDSNGLDFKAIVFYFVPNGNLDRWLHQHHREHGNQTGLDLIQRIDIAIDVASGLEYLHHYKPIPIVHCDLKPSNILLDNDMVAHVGDFGLARFVHQDQNSLSDISSGWATRRGTIGYAAPEYGLGNEVSIYGDIYSFGILLLEIFTGKRPTDGDFVQDLSLHRYVQIALQDHQVSSVADQQLLPAADQECEGRTSSSGSAREMIVACITSILQIGILCSKELPTDRLLIGDALRALQGVKDKYRMHILSEGM